MMKLHWRGVKALDHCRTFRESLVHFSFLLDLRLGRIGRFIPYPGRGFFLRLVFADDKRQLLCVHFDHAQRIEASLLARAGHGR